MIGISNLLPFIGWCRNFELNMVNRTSLTIRYAVCVGLIGALTSSGTLGKDYDIIRTSDKTYRVQSYNEHKNWYWGWHYEPTVDNMYGVQAAYIGRPTGTTLRSSSDTECLQLRTFPVLAYIDNHDKDHELAVDTLLQTLKGCTFRYEPTGTGNPTWSIFRVYVGTSDGYLAYYNSHGGSVHPGPNICTVTLDTMDFGLVHDYMFPITSSDMHIMCTQGANITVTTNHGRQFTDPASGTVIDFTDPPKFDLNSCGTNCVVPIEGRMKKTPNNSGTYKWFVPVVVEYL